MIVARGAEAVLRKEENVLIKERIRKGYRIEKLDIRLRRERTKHEESLMRQARRAGVNVPPVISSTEFEIKMEFIDGPKIKDSINEKNCRKLAEIIGKSIAKMHSFDIVHGDLTTSNMIKKQDEIYFIDFGLGFHSKKVEDKAVDLHLLKQALKSTHFRILEKAWKIILESYEKNCDCGKDVVKRMEQIEKRGRYKQIPSE